MRIYVYMYIYIYIGMLNIYMSQIICHLYSPLCQLIFLVLSWLFAPPLSWFETLVESQDHAWELSVQRAAVACTEGYESCSSHDGSENTSNQYTYNRERTKKTSLKLLPFQHLRLIL